MNIPLYTRTIERDGISKLEIWYNKERRIIPVPFKPYFYSKKRKLIPDAYEENIMHKTLSDLKLINAFKYSFASVRQILEYRDDNTYEDDIPFIQRIAIDLIDFYTQYQQDDNIDMLYFDIEVKTKGLFPRASRDKIIAIAYALNDEPVTILEIKDDSEDDSRIIKEFFQYVSDMNPDIFVGYNCDFFDIPYIIERAIINNISTTSLTRLYGEAYYKDDENQIHTSIHGRCVFDVFREVQQDQTLYGISSRKMKDVAKWFKVEKSIREDKRYKDYNIILEELSNTEVLIGTETLKKYVESDVLITRALSKIYFKNLLEFAKMLNIPLNILTRRSANLIATIFHAREFKNQNIVADLPNYKKHPKIFGEPTIHNRGRTKFINGSGYEGPTVGIYRKGIMKDIYKVDFAGMYPAIIMTFNLSPETCRIIDFKPLGEFHFDRQKDYLIIEFPDKKIEHNVVVKIDMTKEGFLPKVLKEFKVKRDIIKKELKNPDTPKYRKELLTSMSWCLKVFANAEYGINGSAYFRYGEIAISMTTTAMGRYFIGQTLETTKDNRITVDTDGVYTISINDLDKINFDLNKYVEDTCDVKNYLELEQEGPWPKGYFLKMKNYLLVEEDGTIIKHGAIFKGSSKNKLYNKALDKISKAMFETPEDLQKTITECFDFTNLSKTDFMMKTKINKPLNEYSLQPTAGKKGCIQIQIGNQAKDHYDIDIETGDSIDYVKEYYGYKISEKINEDMIDKKYYREQLVKLLHRLDLSQYIFTAVNPTQRKLEDWG